MATRSPLRRCPHQQHQRSTAAGPEHPRLPLPHRAPCFRLAPWWGAEPWAWLDPVPGCPRAPGCSSALGNAVLGPLSSPTGPTGPWPCQAKGLWAPWEQVMERSLPGPLCAMEIRGCGAAAAPREAQPHRRASGAVLLPCPRVSPVFVCSLGHVPVPRALLSPATPRGCTGPRATARRRSIPRQGVSQRARLLGVSGKPLLWLSQVSSRRVAWPGATGRR